MATLDINRHATSLPGVSTRLGSAIDRAYARYVAWNSARTNRNVLSRLSAAELDDIGLSAADLERVARRGTKY